MVVVLGVLVLIKQVEVVVVVPKAVIVPEKKAFQRLHEFLKKAPLAKTVMYR